MRYEKFVEQHRVDRVVAYGVNLAVLVAYHQVRVYLGYFLGDQTKLRCSFCVAFVVKGDGLERENCFAGLLHRLNLFLVTPRMPAMKVLVWTAVPMRMVLDSAATPPLPISILLLPMVRL